MFAAAISLVGLAATVYLVLREAKAIRAQSGTVAKGAIAWSVAFGLFQLFLTIWGAIGLVAQNEPLAFVMLILTNAILTGCAWASIARDRIAPRVFAFAGSDAPVPTGKLARLRGALWANRSSPPSCACCSPASLRCWAWRSRPTTTLPGSTPCAFCSNGPSSPCSWSACSSYSSATAQLPRSWPLPLCPGHCRVLRHHV